MFVLEFPSLSVLTHKHLYNKEEGKTKIIIMEVKRYTGVLLKRF